MKKSVFTWLSCTLALSSCTSTYVISSAGESLSALTKVTDAEKQCISPYGGDEGKDLFYSMEEKGGVFKIYRKGNPSQMLRRRKPAVGTTTVLLPTMP